MMRRLPALFVVFLAFCSGASGVPLKEEWSRHFLNGVSRIQAVDLGDGRGPEIYAITYNPVRTTVFVFSREGEEEDDFVIEPKMKYLYPTEEVLIAFLSDMDGDGLLDIVAGSEAHTGGINKHILYRMERQWDTDLRKYSTVMNWKSEESDLTTSIQLLGYNDSKTRFLVTADRDGSVRVFDSAGNVVERRDFSGSVWDMVPANLDNESDLELVLGMFKKLSVVKGASELWSYPVESRFSRVGAYDLDKDGYAEVLGVSENTLYLFDSRGNLLWKRDFESVGGFDFVYVESVNYTGIAVADNSRVLLLSKDGISGGSYDLGENARALHYYSYGGKSGLVVGTDSSIKYFSFDVSGLLREDAQSLEGTAFEFFYAGRFNDSVEAALRAQEKFSELGDFEALGRLEELVENSSDIMEAEGFYMRARAYFLNGDYNSSTGNANEALKLFRRSGYASGVEKSMALVAGVGEKELADSFYRMAEESYVGSNLSGVVENVDKAIAIYERVNFTQGIEKSRALAYAARLNFNSSAQSTQTTVETPYTTVTFRRANAGGTAEDMTFYAAIVLSVLVVAYAAYSVLKKR